MKDIFTANSMIIIVCKICHIPQHAHNQLTNTLVASPFFYQSVGFININIGFSYGAYQVPVKP
jgi:hypothetical protein